MHQPELSPAAQAALRADGHDVDDVRRVVITALREDLRYGPDATTAATVPAGTWAVAELAPRREGVLAGGAVALAVFDLLLDGEVDVRHRTPDGAPARADEPALVIAGPVSGLLTAERTALNLLCLLSGVASATSAWVAAVDGTGCRVRDSRKTVPGLRLLQKYAVRAGGGVNHRMGLGDAVLIKDNHVAAAGSVAAALAAARAQAPQLACEVEVDTLGQLDEALAAGADEILLDNFAVGDCETAVRVRDRTSPRTRLEVSGGLQLADAAAYAATGVDYLAIGGLTHSAPALDIGLDLRG